jgi:hypothetical protein
MKNQNAISEMVMKANVVNYEALGKVIAEFGPQLATMDDPWENFCGTMRYFIRIYRLPPIGPRIPELDRLERLENFSREL